jgi:hypothetical protein
MVTWNTSDFPAGFTGGVTIRGLSLANTYSSKLFWVDSNGTANGDGTFARPYSTIDAAVGNCTADNGDMILVKAGHVETVSAAGGLACDVAGISIIGLGNGKNRPRINFTATASTRLQTVLLATLPTRMKQDSARCSC